MIFPRIIDTGSRISTMEPEPLPEGFHHPEHSTEQDWNFVNKSQMALNHGKIM